MDAGSEASLFNEQHANPWSGREHIGLDQFQSNRVVE
jgi:hypothetical protein